MLKNLIQNHKSQWNATTTTTTTTSPRNNNNNKTYLLEGCGEYDFYSELNGPRMFRANQYRLLHDNGTLDSRGRTKRFPRLILPQHHYLEELHEQFPNATFLLNLRPTHEWVDSVMRWTSTLRQEIPNEFWWQDHERGFRTFVGNKDDTLLNTYGITQLPPKTKSQIHRTLAYIMDYHSQYVRDFVRTHPSHTLIEVDITRNETGQILAEAFGLNETCWGHFNKNNLTSAPLDSLESVLTRQLRFPQDLTMTERAKRTQRRNSRRPSLWQRLGALVKFALGYGYGREPPEWETRRSAEEKDPHHKSRDQRRDRLEEGANARRGRTAIQGKEGTKKLGRRSVFLSVEGWRDGGDSGDWKEPVVPSSSSSSRDEPNPQQQEEKVEPQVVMGAVARSGDELEMYQVGDTSKEGRTARKELYQERIQQLKLQPPKLE